MEVCEGHGRRMKPPFGWTLVDTRRVAGPPEPISLGLEATSA